MYSQSQFLGMLVFTGNVTTILFTRRGVVELLLARLSTCMHGSCLFIHGKIVLSHGYSFHVIAAACCKHTALGKQTRPTASHSTSVFKKTT